MGFSIRISVVITASSVANPTVLTTEAPHGIVTGDSVEIIDHSGSTPALSGTYTATRVSATQFSIPVNVTVGGTGGLVMVPRRAMVKSLSFRESARDRKHLEVEVIGADDDFRPDLDAQIELYENNEKIFGGIVDAPSEAFYGPGGIKTRISAIDYSSFAENVMFTGTLLNGTLKQQLQQLLPLLADPPYNITLNASQPDGPTMNPKIYRFRYLKEIFEELSVDSGGYLPRWLPDRTFGMFLPSFGAIDAPFQINESDGNHLGDIEVSRSRDNYANRVWVKCGAEAGAETQRIETATMPAGITGGGVTRFGLSQLGISFSEQPTEIIVAASSIGAQNGTKTIGAPGTKNGSDPWEWLWEWNGYTNPVLIHNDAVYSPLPNGTQLTLYSMGVAYWNLREVATRGDLYGSDGTYRWYWIPAPSESFSPQPHTVYINRTFTDIGGSRSPVGVYGTRDEINNVEWEWVWKADIHSLGHRVSATALTAADTIRLYTRDPFELIIQSPPAASEPTAEQSTRGLREIMIEAPDIADPEVGQALGDQYLIQKLVRPKTVRYKTLSGTGANRLQPGQVQSITMASRNLAGEYLITEIVTSLYGGIHPMREVTAIDSVYWQGSWRDTYRKWSGAFLGSGTSVGSPSTTIQGTAGGGGGAVSGQRPVYLLAAGTEAVRSGTPTWVSATGDRIRIRIDTTARGSVSGLVVLRLRLISSSGVSVKARLYNVSDGISVGESSSHTSTSWGTYAFGVALTAGVKYYELQLLPGAANQDVQASGYLE